MRILPIISFAQSIHVINDCVKNEIFYKYDAECIFRVIDAITQIISDRNSRSGTANNIVTAADISLIE